MDNDQFVDAMIKKCKEYSVTYPDNLKKIVEDAFFKGAKEQHLLMMQVIKKLK